MSTVFSQRTVFRAIAFGLLIGAMASAFGGSGTGPVIVTSKCTDDRGCANYYFTDTTQCPDVRCEGQTTTGRIRGCWADEDMTIKCIKDESTQGFLNCPNGVCQDKVGTICSFKIVGCTAP